jgi:hypothetical protein
MVVPCSRTGHQSPRTRVASLLGVPCHNGFAPLLGAHTLPLKLGEHAAALGREADTFHSADVGESGQPDRKRLGLGLGGAVVVAIGQGSVIYGFYE